MSKKWYIVLVMVWPTLFGLGLWNGEYVWAALTGLGFTVSSYYEQKLTTMNPDQAASIRASVNAKLVTFVFVALMILFTVGVFFFDEPRVPLLETIHIVLGSLLTLRGLLIRGADHIELNDASNVIRH
ncbi:MULTISPECIES: hypothetical protein [Exiguobacterium]|uniref:hypothetical protein n=1 Tax=Exiguobacterium TaxID=33986 RepID=UPI001BEB501D|nr:MULTISPECIES: hypothetical protein [Exiguobacterium]MCT4777790.1 hypothetical protein [Exiguobacterium aquaticum]MCT4790429.1 hypothetical protein [Exiguobacterium mexicanum]